MIDTRTNTGKTAFAAALATVIIGAVVLAGWLYGLELLKRLAPGLVAMNPATAVGFILAGASLALFLQSPRGKDQKSRVLILTARLCALLVALIGLTKLAGILCGWDLGVDRWLFASQLPDRLRFPNRMAPNTAFNFLLLGGALLFVDVKNRSVRFWSEFSVVLVGFGSLLAVLAYAYDIQSFYGFNAFTPMALHTAITFSVLTVAFLLSHTDSGLLAILAGDSTGGTLARRLLPAAVLVPAVFGWLSLQGEEAGIFHGQFSHAVFAVGNILVFTFLVCWSANGLFSADLGRKKAEEALRKSQQIIEGILNAIPVRVFWKDKNLVYLGCNATFARDAGFADPKDIIGKDDYQMGWSEQADLYRADDRQVIESGCSKLLIEEPQTTPEGNTITLLSSKIPLRNSKGETSGVLGTYMDITERKRLEIHLIQSQKMETVGKLTGGIAHEFNSILTVIIGESEMLLGDLPAGSPLAKNATRISKSANRAAILTRQLLAYGRKQFLQAEALDLNEMVAGMEGVLSHLLGTDVDTHLVPAAGLRLVKADAGQIEQVVMNLAMNARDAMPHGGKLTLETANVSFEPDSVGRNPDLKPGAYVMLAITDTGGGMSEKVKAHAFEPFFTTKGVGQGTGLGLSTCYGIIKQSGGHINVYSEPGRGTTFKIYLPQAEPPPKVAVEHLDAPEMPRGTETILLAEDDPDLREMAATLLRRLGYTVLASAKGIEALSLKQPDGNGHVDLLFTDVVMPHMSGKELSDRVRALYPHTRILFTSAYTENAIVHQGLLDPGVAFLLKPYTPGNLARKLREVLDVPVAPQPDPAQKTFGFTKSSDEAKSPGN